MRSTKLIIIGLLLMGLALVFTACQSTPEPCPTCPTPQPTVACPTCPEAPACPECPAPLVADVPNEAAWAASGHADATAEAFRHWDDTGEVEPDCARCHSPTGYQDFLGADGTAAGTIENTHPASNGLTCVTCHNPAAEALTAVTFPSGVEVTGLGASARCMVCHQGRQSGVAVETAITDLGLGETPDTVSADLSYINIHYFAAAATLYGGVTNGAYQYAGMSYEGKNLHVEGYGDCVGCHDSHSLAVRVERCTECHTNVATEADLVNIRMNGSLVDYDGDGDITEGIAGEISGLQEKLLTAMLAYGTEVTGMPVAYTPDTRPYLFNDLNGNGVVDTDEAVSENAYVSYTPRLLRAFYNYKVSLNDPGAFAHNAKYVIQYLFDSITDLNSVLSNPLDMSAAHRNDAGHFDGTAMAFRDWDSEGEVPGRCARCHSSTGLLTYINNGVNIAAETTNGFECSTCHDVANFPATYAVDTVTFPSGASLTFGEGNAANLCMECHQGRQSTVSVNQAIGTLGNDEVSTSLRFLNPHYFAAAGTLFGTEAQGAYEFAGQTYKGHHPHVDMGLTCTSCHDAHGAAMDISTCTGCHQGATSFEDIRMTATDYDGDGATEGIAGEITGYQAILYAAIQNYAANTAGAPIIYDASSNPYWFGDANANGVRDADEVAYASYTPNLLRAAFNYQWVMKDPGAFAHNGQYILQVLYDSIVAVGGDVTGLTRP